MFSGANILLLLTSNHRFKDHSALSSSESDSDVDAAHQQRSKILKPVVCLGWQPNSDVFVLGKNLHFKNTGEAIPLHEQDYVSIPFILEKLGVYTSIQPINTLPDVPNLLYKVMEGIHHVAGANHTCAIFCLSM